MAKANEKAMNENAPALDVEALLAAAQAKIDEMLKDAQAKADEIIEKAEAKAGKNTNLNELSKRLNEEGEEYVTIQLFRDNDKYADDVFVAINGEGCNVPRGIPTRIKKKFAREIEKSSYQDAKTAQYITEKENEYKAESKARNI